MARGRPASGITHLPGRAARGARRPRAAPHAHPTPALLEREGELSEVRRALAEARAGRGTILAFTGEWGIGRSALLAAARREALAAGCLVLGARCAPHERAFPYAVALQLLEGLRPGAADGRDALFARAPFAGAGAAASFLEAPERAPADEREAALLAHSLFRVVANLARARPLLLAVDDAQWADPGSQLFLRHLAARLSALPVAVVVAARGSAGGPEGALLAALPQRRLAALGPSSVRRLLADARGGCSAELAEWCHWATGGVPALVAAAAEALARADDLVDPRSQPADGLVSPGLRRRLEAELAVMPPGSRDVARAAATLGSAARDSRIAALCGLGEQEVAAARAALESGGILEMARPWRFARPLLEVAVLGSTPPSEDSRLHAEAARLLREEGEGGERIAAHLLRAEPAARGWVAADLRRAASAAAAQGDPSLAVALLQRALAEPPPAEERADVALELGRALAAAGRPTAAAATLAPLARGAGHPDGSVEATLELARLRASEGELEEAAAILGEALAAGAAVDPERERLEADRMALSLAHPGLRPAAAERAASAAAGESSLGPELCAYAACHLALTGEPDERVGRLAQRALRARPSPRVRGAALQALLWTGALEEVCAGLREARTPVGLRAEPGDCYELELIAAQLAQLEGCLREAEAHAERAAALGGGAAAARLECAQARLALITLDRGDPAGAQRIADDALAGERLRGSLARAGVLLARAEALCAQGATREALADAEAAAQELEPAGVCNPAAAPWRSVAAVALLALGERERARELAAEGLACARRLGVPHALARALRTAATVAGRREAIALLREAEEALRGTRLRTERAAVLVELGAAYRKHSSQRRARTVLREALATATRIGAGHLVGRARGELELAAARGRGRPASGAAALTPAERRVVALALTGLSNREIAERIFVTRKTVEWHLHNAFRKLDVRSRAELAAALGEA
jgi:DNA-binding CsgD family transcriptional regulator